MGTPRPSWLGLIAAAIAGATAVTYLMLIRGQGDSLLETPVLSVFVGISACAALAGIGALSMEPKRRFNLLLGATLGLFLFGLMGIFSVGFPLLIGGVLTLIEVLTLRPVVGKGHLAQGEARRQEMRRQGKKPFR